jgi:hypothetical protein
MSIISIRLTEEDLELCASALALSCETSSISRHKLMKEILRDGFLKIIENGN